MKLLYLLICRVTSLTGWLGSGWSNGLRFAHLFFFCATGRSGWSMTSRGFSFIRLGVTSLSACWLRFAPTEPVSAWRGAVCWLIGPEGSSFPLVFIATGSRQVQLGAVC
jgi:hypothetical protein